MFKIMKNVLFVVTYLNTGGISRSLQSILNYYDTSIYKVDVFAMVHQGAFGGQFANCTLLPKCSILESSVAHLDQRRGISKITSAILKVIDKGTSYAAQRYLFRRVGRKLLREKQTL